MRSTARRTYVKTASGELITDALVEELSKKAEAGYEVEGMANDIGHPPSVEVKGEE